MKKMLNTLYVMTEDAYAGLNSECVEINYSDGTRKAVPLHTLEHIVLFSYKGASPALMGKCESLGITIAFYSPQGKYLAMTGVNARGNVLLRREQYRISEHENESLRYARNFMIGKLYNSKSQIHRIIRDHPMQINADKLRDTASSLDLYMNRILESADMATLRGIEGKAAAEYFSVYNEFILQRKDTFYFSERNRKPPLDPINALLSFAYTLLANDCANALTSVGLDAYSGFYHTDRPGRKSLALDLMEELRVVIAERVVLFMINNRVFDSSDFIKQESGAVLLTDEARKAFISKWQAKKREEIVHPFLKEKIMWGLVPYAQALLLARSIRGVLDEYPPFFWR